MTVEPETSHTIDEYAAVVLAEAMAYRLDPTTCTPPTDDMFKRATEVVTGMMDLAGRRVVVLLCGSRADAKRLAIACGKNGEHVDEALRVLDRLAEL